MFEQRLGDQLSVQSPRVFVHCLHHLEIMDILPVVITSVLSNQNPQREQDKAYSIQFLVKYLHGLLQVIFMVPVFPQEDDLCFLGTELLEQVLLPMWMIPFLNPHLQMYQLKLLLHQHPIVRQKQQLCLTSTYPPMLLRLTIVCNQLLLLVQN